ncbi:MAG TPA: hypothetical protein VIG48_03430 [Jatrophihabitans sp.]|jgi:hypothetical protein
MNRRPRRAVRSLLAAAVACVAAALVVPGSASAADAETVQVSIGGAAFSSHPAGVLLDVNGLAPGEDASGTMALRSAMHSGARLTVQFIDITDDGQLGSALRFSIGVAGSEHGAFVARWSGTGTQLGEPIDLGTVVGVGATKWVRLTASLPAETGNVVQADTFRFGVRVVLQDVGGSGVAGVSVHNGPGGGSGVDSASSSPLSLTGVPMILLVGAAVLLLLAGGVVLASARRRAA